MIPELKDTMCITQILAPVSGFSPMTKAECNQAVSEGKLGITACYPNGNDYWAGAVRACGGVQNMPTQAQLTALAEYIYPDADSIGSSGTTSGLNWDADRASLFLAQSPYSYFYVWSGQEYSQSNAYDRYFSPTSTGWGYGSRYGSDLLAVCIFQ